MISARLRIWHEDTSGLVPVYYLPDVDPLSLIFDFPRGRRWLIGRDLTRAGCDGRVGEGDVRVRPHLLTRKVVLTLSNPEEAMDVWVDRAVLIDLLDRTYRAVPRCREGHFLAIDELIDNILEDAWPI